MPVKQPSFSPEELQTEEWLSDAEFYPDYSGSTLGRLRRDISRGRSSKAGHILKYGLTKKGRYKVQLWKDGVGRWFNVATVIARIFHGPCPKGKEVDHKNTNKLDDRVLNLHYVTHRENVDRAMAAGVCPSGDDHYSRRNPEKLARGERNGNSKLTNAENEEMIRRYAAGETLIELGEAYGMHFTSIQARIPIHLRRPCGRKKRTL